MSMTKEEFARLRKYVGKIDFCAEVLNRSGRMLIYYAKGSKPVPALIEQKIKWAARKTEEFRKQLIDGPQV